MPAKPFDIDLEQPMTFTMEELAQLRAVALEQCNGQDFHFQAVKLLPVITTKNIYFVFLFAYVLVEFAKHVMVQIRELNEGEFLVVPSELNISPKMSALDVISPLERKRDAVHCELTEQHDCVEEYTRTILTDIIVEVREKAGLEVDPLEVSELNM